MSGLYIGVSGMRTSQNALNTTAHNLANVDTKGFVRQQVVLKDTMYRSLKVDRIGSNQVGYGVTTDIVRQVRDQFLDKSYRLEVGRQGFYDAQYTAVSELENVFGELEGVAFQDSIEDFWTSIQELVKEPDSITQKGLLVQTAVSLMERAELLQKQLTEYQLNLNTEILDTVHDINSIGDQISRLNKEICKVESAGVEQANDLRDERNLLLDELGQLANITYKEDANGIITVNIEGVQFVSQDNVYKMQVETLNGASDMLKPVWPHLGQDVYTARSDYNSNDNTDIGYLHGLLVSRGEFVANFTDIPSGEAPKREDFPQGEDGLQAYRDALETHQKAMEEYELITSQSVIMTMQSQFDQLIHGLVTSINDILSPNKTITIWENGVQKEVQVLDEANAPIGSGEGNEVAGTELFSRKCMPRYTEVEVYLSPEDEANGILTKVQRYNEEDPNNNYSLYTLGEMEVNPEILQDLSKLPINTQGSTGAYDNSVCEKLMAVWESDFAALGPEYMTNYSIKDYYTAMIGQLATKGNTIESIVTNQAQMSNTIDSQRSAMTGVSSDEELSNMIKFQHAYNASARYVNVVSEMLEHIVSKL